ncbi:MULTISPECIES: hypothetical protein [Pseudoxanthomonas]|jgi:uncharacterized protein YcfJ|uniref:hypothetical protein n=1 Tax=Pseudoxanthomonas TaxID=83618 RepID=UPI0013EF1B46|nr:MULTISPECIES: hypothetical protein [Pseudoxanthomonas]UAY76399.1 hypothetical protein LAJ50_09315 [Pseudoxanthomonas sp. X-1]
MPPASRALLIACLSVCLPAAAQQVSVVPVENVRIDYAQVMAVEPVYQTLRATRSEPQCDDAPAAGEADDAPKAEGRIARLVDSVKGVFSSDEKNPKPEPAPAKPPASGQNCRMVTVEREFRRPIAYDVDYVYKGTKYRSRLPEDPGNRLRIRVSVTPYAPGQQRAGNP